MDKTFYIIPNTRTCYGERQAEDADSAMQAFVDTMDMDMNAYFDAVEEKPVTYPHSYEYAYDRFQKTMSAIMACLSGDRASSCYMENVTGRPDTGCMDAVAALQQAYDLLWYHRAPMATELADEFCNILERATGFDIGRTDSKKGHVVGFGVDVTVVTACKVLTRNHVSYNRDRREKELLFVREDILPAALKVLGENDIIVHMSGFDASRWQIVVSDIYWSTDDMAGTSENNLPSCVTVEDPVLISRFISGMYADADSIAEWLTDTYGCCVCGFVPELELKGVDEK